MTMEKNNKPSVWSLYIVRCRDGTLYTGISTDVKRRFQQHQDSHGAKYLKNRSPLELVFKYRVGKQSHALKIESQIKRLTKERKLKVIQEPGYFKDLLKKMRQTTKT
jgi:putative endonuclease